MCLGGSLAKRQMCFGPVWRITLAVNGPARSITLAITGLPARSIIPAVTGLAPVILQLHKPRILTTCLYGVYMLKTGLGSVFISYFRSLTLQAWPEIAMYISAHLFMCFIYIIMFSVMQYIYIYISDFRWAKNYWLFFSRNKITKSRPTRPCMCVFIHM